MKYSVLTCIFCNYEILRKPEVIDSEAEYVCVTDNKELQSDGVWQIKYLPDFFSVMPDVNKWSYIRFHPFEFVSNNVCLYLDGSVQIMANIQNDIIKPFVYGDYIYGTLVHLNTNITDSGENYTIYSDVDTWVNGRNCDKGEGDKCKAFLKKFDNGRYSTFQSGLMMFKDCQRTTDINNHIWELMHYLGNDKTVYRNNQMVMSYILSMEMYKDSELMTISPLILNSDYFQIYMHGSDYYIFDIYDVPNTFYIFNEYTEPVITRVNKPIR